MGIFDKAKDLVNEHADKIDDAVDKVAKVADEKTGGKYSDKIQQGADAIKDQTGKASGDADSSGSAGTPGPA